MHDDDGSVLLRRVAKVGARVGGGWFGEDIDDRSIVEGGSSSSTGGGTKEHQNREQKGTTVGQWHLRFGIRLGAKVALQ